MNLRVGFSLLEKRRKRVDIDGNRESPPPPLSLHYLSLQRGASSYHTQQPPVLLECGAAAQHACYHDDDSSQDEDVGGGGVGLGGEEADVVGLLDQGPNTHRHHDAPCQLGGAEFTLSHVGSPRCSCQLSNISNRQAGKLGNNRRFHRIFK